MHLLGITRTELVKDYERYGVASFDSTSPFRQAFKDDRDNYYAPRAQVPRDPRHADRQQQPTQAARARRPTRSEHRAEHSSRRACARSSPTTETNAPSTTPLDALAAYDSFLGEPDRQSEYWRTLHDRPWRSCPCGICAEVGIQVVIFRGTERNKRRGFHNLFVFNQPPTQGTRTRMRELRVPALRLTQGPTREIYSFGIDGKILHRFAAVSRVGRDDDAAIRGYQRPEVLSHINAIRAYIESETPMIPNGIVVAFDSRVRFEPARAASRRLSAARAGRW